MPKLGSYFSWRNGIKILPLHVLPAADLFKPDAGYG